MGRPTSREVRECIICGESFEVILSSTKKLCTRSCAHKFTGIRKRKDRSKECEFCGNLFEAKDPRNKSCSISCARKLTIRDNPGHLDNLFKARDESSKKPEVVRARSERLKRMWESEKFRENNHERMTSNNPTHQPGVVEKISQTLRERGYDFSHLTGGNGVSNRYEDLLQEALGAGWENQYVYVTTGIDRQEGAPNHYKIDLAKEDVKLAIEVDGRSHLLAERKEQDRRKTVALERSGWTVLRFTNAEVGSRIASVVTRVKEVEAGLRTPK